VAVVAAAQRAAPLEVPEAQEQHLAAAVAAVQAA
jgi:hypothetical protein